MKSQRPGEAPAASSRRMLSMLRLLSLGLGVSLVASFSGDGAVVDRLAVLPRGAGDAFAVLHFILLCIALGWIKRGLRAQERTSRVFSRELAGETDEMYRSLFEDSQDAIFFSRPDGSVKNANPAAVRMFGFASKEDLLAVDARDLYKRPEDREELMRRLAAEGSVRDFELTLKNRKGKTIAALETSTAVRDEAGRVIAFRGILRDVTEERKLENLLRQSQKMEALGQLAAGIAHDFNNLLTVINGFAELGLQRTRPSEPIGSDLKQIQQAGHRAAALTRQLLAFTRQQVLRPRVIDLNRVVSEFRQLLGRTIGDDVELAAELDPDLGKVKADPGQIEQVLLNLVLNSRDAMPHGGRIVVETAQKDLDEAYASNYVTVEPGSYCMLAVSDNGTGIDRETQRRVFEPFFTTKVKGKGTGLGLSTVYGIVKQSGGTIWVYSEPGEGTTVKIYLPCVDGEEEMPAAARETGPIGECTETVLVVDDDEGVRSFAVKILEAQGFRVLAARSVPDALEVFEKHDGEIALVVTDIVMSGMPGMRLVERLPSVKTILMSGYTEQVAMRSEPLRSDVPFIGKPFSGAELVRKVREVLNGPSGRPARGSGS